MCRAMTFFRRRLRAGELDEEDREGLVRLLGAVEAFVQGVEPWEC